MTNVMLGNIQHYAGVLCGLIIVLLVVTFVDAVQQKSLTCWRCNNGEKPSKICEKADPMKEHKDTGEGSQGTIDLAKDTYHVNKKSDCREVMEFFNMYNIVGNNWNKRHLAKGRSIGHYTQSDYDQPYCVTVSVVATNFAGAPQVYRDCIRGNNETIKGSFKDMINVEGVDVKDGGDVDFCKTHKPASEKGIKKIEVCICNKDKCNKRKANHGSGILPSVPFTSLVIAFLTLIHFYGV